MATPMTPPQGAAAFLARVGWADAVITPLAGDASFRRYFRVRRGEQSAVLMDAPPPEDPRPFISIAGYLREHGLSAPEIYASDVGEGLVLLEDFGDARFAPLLSADPAREAELYRLALTGINALAAIDPPPGLPRFDWPAYERELLLFVDWYLPAVGINTRRESFLLAWRDALSPVLEAQHAFVLLDFHVDNLMLLEGRSGVSALGLLDFQDARTGHPVYDLVSLLRDARRDVSPAVESEALAGRDPEFLAAYELLGAQRDTKILGIFARLWKRDGKPGYLRHLPRVWGYLERELAHPALGPVRAWLDENVPPSARASAWGTQ